MQFACCRMRLVVYGCSVLGYVLLSQGHNSCIWTGRQWRNTSGRRQWVIRIHQNDKSYTIIALCEWKFRTTITFPRNRCQPLPVSHQIKNYFHAVCFRPCSEAVVTTFSHMWPENFEPLHFVVHNLGDKRFKLNPLTIFTPTCDNITRTIRSCYKPLKLIMNCRCIIIVKTIQDA